MGKTPCLQLVDNDIIKYNSKIWACLKKNVILTEHY